MEIVIVLSELCRDQKDIPYPNWLKDTGPNHGFVKKKKVSSGMPFHGLRWTELVEEGTNKGLEKELNTKIITKRSTAVCPVWLRV